MNIPQRRSVVGQIPQRRSVSDLDPPPLSVGRGSGVENLHQAVLGVAHEQGPRSALGGLRSAQRFDVVGEAGVKRLRSSTDNPSCFAPDRLTESAVTSVAPGSYSTSSTRAPFASR